jgi:hypothetical protein
VSREQRKAETRRQQGGQLTPAGQGRAEAKSRPVDGSREQRRPRRRRRTSPAADPAGQGGAPQTKSTQAPSTKTRAERKAETAAANKAGKLTPAGEGAAQK